MDKLGIRLVLDIVIKKTDNQIRFLKKLAYARPGKTDGLNAAITTLEELTSKIGALEKETNLDGIRQTLMGLEGSAGRTYFKCLSTIMPEKYRFDGRSRRPAKDPFNSVLNYALGILYSRVEKACIIAGLDPFVGFLHTDNFNKKSLVFDLIEPFRIYAEQTAVYLFTGKKINDTFFDKTDFSVSLNDKGKPVVIESFNHHLDETVRYRGKNVKRKYIIQHEAHKMANILLGEDSPGKRDWLTITEF